MSRFGTGIGVNGEVATEMIVDGIIGIGDTVADRRTGSTVERRKTANTAKKFALKEIGNRRHDILRSCDGEVKLALASDEHGAEIIDNLWAKLTGKKFSDMLAYTEIFLVDLKVSQDTEPELVTPIGYMEFYSDARIQSGKGSMSTYMSADTLELIKEAQTILGATLRFDIEVRRYGKPTSQRVVGGMAGEISKKRETESITVYSNAVFTSLPDATLTNKKNGIENVSAEFVFERAEKVKTFFNISDSRI